MIKRVLRMICSADSGSRQTTYDGPLLNSFIFRKSSYLTTNLGFLTAQFKMAQAEYWPRYGLENYYLVSPFERNFDSVHSTKWMQENWFHSISSSFIYVLSIYIGQKVVSIQIESLLAQKAKYLVVHNRIESDKKKQTTNYGYKHQRL